MGAWHTLMYISKIFSGQCLKNITTVCCYCSVAPLCLTVTPWTAALQASLSFTISLSLLKLLSVKSMVSSNHLILCCPLLLPSVFPSIRVFSNVQLFASCGQSIGASASASVPPKSIQGWFPLRLTGLIFLLSKGLSRVFFSTTVEKRQFFSTLPSLLSNSHNHTWPLERSYPWLYGPMSAKWCLCFMTLCLNKEKLSQLNIVSLNKSCEKNLKQNIKKNSRNLYDKN